VLPQLLISCSAAIVLFLGTLHLVYTFASRKFSPRDSALEDRLKLVSPIISKQTTMWKAWIGFNASHSLGAMLFGVLYGYFAIWRFQMLAQDRFLAVVGASFLVSFLILAKRYWFNIPFAGIASALALYLAGFAMTLV
jgi:hypothetical protein